MNICRRVAIIVRQEAKTGLPRSSPGGARSRPKSPAPACIGRREPKKQFRAGYRFRSQRTSHKTAAPGPY
jgi:hypothetical protein